jgi:hypothetical protein
MRSWRRAIRRSLFRGVVQATGFAPHTTETEQWSPRQLLKRLKIARHRLHGSGAAQAHQKVLPEGLNPAVAVAQPQVNPPRRPRRAMTKARDLA